MPGPVTLAAVPSGPVFPNQQFPVLPGKNSLHQKSLPFGFLCPAPPVWALPNMSIAPGKNPFGALPTRLRKNRCRTRSTARWPAHPGTTPGKMSPSAPPLVRSRDGEQHRPVAPVVEDPVVGCTRASFMPG